MVLLCFPNKKPQLLDWGFLLVFSSRCLPDSYQIRFHNFLISQERGGREISNHPEKEMYHDDLISEGIITEHPL